MGFKKVDFDELRTKIGPNFLGIPIRGGEKLVEKGFREKKIETSYMGSLSEILILNEEFLEFQYSNDGKRKSAIGNGNISVFNNSMKDRIWDANLQFSGSQFDDQDNENNIELGIFEPNSNKVLKYEILSSEELPDLVKVHENIENNTEGIEDFTKTGGESSFSEYKLNNYILLQDKENTIKFTISIANVSNSILEKIKFKKFFSENFYDLEFESNKTNDFKITRNSVECPLNSLNPGEKAEILVVGKVFPKKKQNIKTGNLELTFKLANKVISGVKINHFSGYSHAMHAIKKTEKNYAPNHWQCSLIFENHSDFKMKLQSVLIYDKTRSNKILDLDFSSENKIVVPRGKFTSEYFDYIDEKEPTFSRKVWYSVEFKTEGNSMITSKYDEITFKIACVLIKKKLAEGEVEIKSFEETTLNSKIIINNQGTLPIKALRIIERIPEDFLPPRDITEYKLYRSSGTIDHENLELELIPDDADPSHEHLINLSINLKDNRLESVIEIEDFLEVKYPLKAITPDYKKAYNFPLNTLSYYPKYIDSLQNEFSVVTDDLLKMGQSNIKISHRRRKLMIGKEIFPGRSTNEFAIYIIAKNGSNIKLDDVSITDTFPDSFELISSNIDHNLSKSKKNGEQKISFTIDSIAPYQEREVMYYLKSVGSKDAKHTELESFFIG